MERRGEESTRFFSREEAQSLVRQLQPRLSHWMQERYAFERKVGEWRKQRDALLQRKGEIAEDALFALEAALRVEKLALEGEVASLRRVGIQPCCLWYGAFDFAETTTRHFCWRWDETYIAYMHFASEGYAQRRPLER
ncbi:MAG: DUF2203 family protein [Firmicutes bacterium]|nr:DUF2203 family protein [Bacillota bacterium]